MPCGGYDKSSYYYFVFSTHCFLIILCLACIANESCDSCRAGTTTSPLIIILCSQHTAFLLFCVWHAYANESCDSCRAGATTSPLIIILCSQHTTFLLFCVWHALPTSRVTHAVRGLRQVRLLLFCVCNTPLFYYLQVLLLLFCVCNTPLCYYLLHSLSGM